MTRLVKINNPLKFFNLYCFYQISGKIQYNEIGCHEKIILYTAIVDKLNESNK